MALTIKGNPPSISNNVHTRICKGVATSKCIGKLSEKLQGNEIEFHPPKQYHYGRNKVFIKRMKCG